MSNALETLGIKKQNKGSFEQSLFYFMREFHFNPLDEYDGEGKMIKKGISIPLFNALMNEMQEHYKKENEQMKKANRRR